MANLYIIRGIPGSGKTTLANNMRSAGMVDCVVEADQYMVDHEGNYFFDPASLRYCHERCQDEVKLALAVGANCAVANTFTRKWEMKPYFDMAERGGHNVTEIICGGRFGSIHGVPQEKIEDMFARFEY